MPIVRTRDFIAIPIGRARPPYLGAGARISVSAFSRASIFACMAVSCARSAPTFEEHLILHRGIELGGVTEPGWA